METTQVSVPIHDITHKVDEILRQLNAVQSIATDPTSVQATIDRLQAIKLDIAICCCYTQTCAFQVVNEVELPIAV